MTKLFKNANVVNVFTKEVNKCNVLIEDEIIIGFGNYDTADEIIDLNNKYLVPGLIDGHMHIESTMLEPKEFTKIALIHGTTSVIADPHEITNVCGLIGIEYMLEATVRMPISFYFMMPSCVPATGFDESFEKIDAKKIEAYYNNPRVLGLAEMMNYPGVIYDDKDVLEKIEITKKHNKLIDGHAPMLSGKDLDKYIRAGIITDHESSTLEEGLERISKGQWLQIREGTAAKNLKALSPILDMPCASRALFVTDDREPNDLLKEGHVDQIIRKAIKLGKNPIVAISLATINAATCYRLNKVGAIAPGYYADILVVDNLEDFNILDVYKKGMLVATNNEYIGPAAIPIDKNLKNELYNSFHMNDVNEGSFKINCSGKHKTRIIDVIPNELLTNELIEELDYDINNGISIENDVLKIAVIERHNYTGHIGIGFIKGIGLKKGAIASSVSHDSHNLIVIGTSDSEMAIAAQRIKELGGGNVVVCDGKVISELPLPIAGLMSDQNIYEVCNRCQHVRDSVKELGVNDKISPFMNMAFISLPVIPNLKLTTLGLVDVNKFELVDLIVK